MSRLGEMQYNILHSNCEHFAHWCRNGHEVSLQAEIAEKQIIERETAILHKKEDINEKVDAVIDQLSDKLQQVLPAFLIKKK
jgi:hypothetical protein